MTGRYLDPACGAFSHSRRRERAIGRAWTIFHKQQAAARSYGNPKFNRKKIPIWRFLEPPWRAGSPVP
jgi:hypothetical protein